MIQAKTVGDNETSSDISNMNPTFVLMKMLSLSVDITY